MQATRDARSGDASASVLGFDFGTRLIGVAVGNRLTGSRALCVVSATDNGPDWPRIDALMREWNPASLIVGLPLGLDGSEQPMSRAARAFGATLAERYGLAIHFVDERHTSNEAARRFAAQRAQGKARRKDAASLDALAASIILEDWLAHAPTDA